MKSSISVLALAAAALSVLAQETASAVESGPNESVAPAESPAASKQTKAATPTPVKGDSASVDAKLSINQGNYFSPTIVVNGTSVLNIFNQQSITNNILTQAIIQKFQNNVISYYFPQSGPNYYYKPCVNCQVVVVNKACNCYVAPPPGCQSCPPINQTVAITTPPPPPSGTPGTYAQAYLPLNYSGPMISGAPAVSYAPVPTYQSSADYRMPPMPGQTQAPYFNMSGAASPAPGTPVPGVAGIPGAPGSPIGSPVMPAMPYGTAGTAGTPYYYAPGSNISAVPFAPVVPDVAAPTVPFGGSPAGAAAAVVSEAIAAASSAAAAAAASSSSSSAAAAAAVASSAAASAAAAAGYNATQASIPVPLPLGPGYTAPPGPRPSTPQESAAERVAQQSALSQADAAFASLAAEQASLASAAATLPVGSLVSISPAAVTENTPGAIPTGSVASASAAIESAASGLSPAGSTPSPAGGVPAGSSSGAPAGSSSGAPAAAPPAATTPGPNAPGVIAEQSNTATKTQSSLGALVVIGVMYSLLF
ncbi:MAG: hypothetical protein M1814_000741 [Vezdaea aestivalis]|nr:MAG: hypothetical protein M1814_000741 [Vezdaea aestivalis]